MRRHGGESPVSSLFRLLQSSNYLMIATVLMMAWKQLPVIKLFCTLPDSHGVRLRSTSILYNAPCIVCANTATTARAPIMSDETHGQVAQHNDAFALPGPWTAPSSTTVHVGSGCLCGTKTNWHRALVSHAFPGCFLVSGEGLCFACRSCVVRTYGMAWH